MKNNIFSYISPIKFKDEFKLGDYISFTKYGVYARVISQEKFLELKPNEPRRKNPKGLFIQTNFSNAKYLNPFNLFTYALIIGGIPIKVSKQEVTENLEKKLSNLNSELEFFKSQKD